MRDLLRAAADHAADHFEAQAERPIRPDASAERDPAPRSTSPLPDGPADPAAVLDDLVADAAPGLMRHRLPALLRLGHAAACCPRRSPPTGWSARGTRTPAARSSRRRSSAIEERRRRAGCSTCSACPDGASFGFVTGCQMAHVTALAAARHAVLARAGWDVERDGLTGAPRDPRARRRGAPHHGRPRAAPARLRHARRSSRSRRTPTARCGRTRWPRRSRADGPAIVCAQAGNVNTGAIDPHRRGLRRRARGRRVGARRRRVRAVGGGEPSAARARGRRRAAPTRGRPTRTSG